MSEKKDKKILFIVGFFDGHIPGQIEMAKELVSLGYSITCYVPDKFEKRFKNTGAKLKVFTIGKIVLPPEAPPLAINAFSFAKYYDLFLGDFLKSPEKYDYLLIDSFFDEEEINKIMKIPKIISVYAAHLGPEISTNKSMERSDKRKGPFIPINKKYNLNIGDFFLHHYINKTKYKLLLTSKLFHPSESIDDTFYFIGPGIEERPIDNNFNFKKEENKKLIYISLGTIFDNLIFYKKCIEAFGNMKEFQVIISIGKNIKIEELGALSANIYVYNYVPQLQILKQTDIFLTHGGISSINEAFFLFNLPIIVIPQDAEQAENSCLIEKFHAGIVLNKNNITFEILKDAVNRFLEKKESFKKGINIIVESFKEARKDRKKIYEQIFI